MEPNIYLQSSVWFANLGGNGTTGTAKSSRTFDVGDTLDLGGKEKVPSFDAFFRWGKSRVIFSWNKGSYSGDNHLHDDLGFNGLTFPAGGKLRSDLDYDRRRLLYGRPLLDGKRLALGFLIGLESYRVDANLRMKGTGSGSSGLDSRVPVLGASLTLSLVPGLRIYGEATSTSWERSGIKSKLISAYGDIEYSFISDILAVTLGYRYSYLDADQPGEHSFVLRQEGAFAGLALKL
ncbi:MAG TPA: hypothetical protein VNI57_08860 [Candidatus Saccharimonadales bacterium]|nr:hypothetical protein [Candidatus Saccharimonadales bacterium]